MLANGAWEIIMEFWRHCPILQASNMNINGWIFHDLVTHKTAPALSGCQFTLMPEENWGEKSAWGSKYILCSSGGCFFPILRAFLVYTKPSVSRR